MSKPVVLDDKWKSNRKRIADTMVDIVQRTGNLAPIIPLLFAYNSEPVTLRRHYQFEICFTHKRPRRVIKKCARQTGKSFQNAIEVQTRQVMIPNWNILYVTPLFEQVRRFSTQYVAALIAQSPIKQLLTLKGGSSQVLQRTSRNRSTLYFTYAQRDADRARGINANEVAYDEVQMINRDVFPVLQQVMGGSIYGEYELFSGTPLSPQNYSEELFRRSTMSEWMIPCRHCNYDNVASVEFDLLKMIGPYHPDIGEDCPGLVCARCSPHNNVRNLKHIYPEDGRWWHRCPERREDFLGIHVPQPVMHWHAYDRDRWLNLTNRLASGDEIAVYNEILGECADSSFKPVSETDLKRIAVLPWENKFREAMEHRYNYPRLALGIDWGGYGTKLVSRTKAAIVGITATGKTDVLFGVDLRNRPLEETQALMVLAQQFGVEIIAHDVGGGVGSTRETMMYQTGYLNCEIWPMSYQGPMTNAMIRRRDGNAEGETLTYVIDKARSLMFLCQAIKQGHLRTFKYDYVNRDNPGLLTDFTALTSEISRRVQGSDVLLIDREEGLSDDFAHAVNFACLALWSKYGCYPKLNVVDFVDTVQTLANSKNLLRASKQWSTEDVEKLLSNIVMSHSA